MYLIWVAGIALQREDAVVGAPQGGGVDAVGNARVPLSGWMDGWMEMEMVWCVCVSVCVREPCVLDLGGRVLRCSE